ncbi:MAG: class I SAM-dependent methyltransferase [Alphaproteobacteria bacterium]
MIEVNQSWDPERYARTARFVSDRARAVLEWLAAQPGETILDLGCGDGVLTEALSRAGVLVVGVDADKAMVAATQALGVEARVLDACELDYTATFDAVFSNAALHWVRDADAVLRGVARALKPGGRFVGEFGGAGNVKTVIAALTTKLAERDIAIAETGPWYFPTETAYAERLEAHGFVVDRIGLFPRPTPLPGPLADWLDNFAESFLSLVPENQRPGLKRQVADIARPTLCDDDGIWTVDYVRLRFAAHRR